jgi:hypothetical protein
MSKKNKRKKCIQDRKPITSHLAITKTYFDDFTKTARKFMQLVGLKPSDFDALSKRTKEHLMLIRHTPYRIRAEKGSHVPRAYIQFFNNIMSQHERKTFYGDPKFNITFLEYMTYGMTLIFAMRGYNTDDTYWNLDQVELLEKIKTPLIKYTDDNEEDHFAVRSNKVLWGLFMYVSQPNYRYYTCKEQGVINWSKCCLENQITVSSIEPERKKFIIDGKTHSAYRLAYYDLFPGASDLAPIQTEIPLSLLSGEKWKNANQEISETETEISLPVFIQNHALRRAAERMDCKDNMYRNHIFMASFLIPQVITATNGQRLIKALDVTAKPIGYFPFIKQDDAVLLLSFLPLSSPITPEGSILYKELGIQMEDSKYFGLDKFSFYTNTDFDTIPKLKQALQKADMWHLTEIQPIDKTERKEDQILKHFFVENNVVVEMEYC